MASTVWKGQLSFGLVSIPVKLFRAARAERIKFHQLNRSNASRVRRQFVSEVEPQPEPEQMEPEPAPSAVERAPRRLQAAFEAPRPSAPPFAPPPPAVESRPVAPSELVKGYEFEKDRYVTIEKQDLESLAPKTSREMEIIEFVKFAEIDPVYLESSYYVSPDRGGEKPYSMLFGALRKTGYVALARVAMHNREHIAVIRPGSKGILMHTMYFTGEVRREQEFAADTSAVTPKEMDLAVMLIEALAAAFDPEKFKDTYREKVEALIAAKVRGEQTVQAPEPAKAEVIDIVAALKSSLALARKPVASAEKAARPRKSRAGGT